MFSVFLFLQGLGKTVMVCAYLSGLFDSKLIHSVLLVAPVSVLDNWQQHLKKLYISIMFIKYMHYMLFRACVYNYLCISCPGVRVATYHGTSAKQRTDSMEIIRLRGGVLLTSYGTTGD